MNFNLTEEERLLRDTVREFATKELAPMAPHWDRTGEFPRANLKKMAELGLMGMPFPEEVGGAGTSVLSYVMAIEEIARACASTAVILAVHTSVGTMPIYLYGSAGQKQKYLKKLCRGEYLGAFALTEPSAGSDATSIRTSARDMGDHYLVSGTKVFITNGGEADVYVTFVVTDPRAGHRGISCLLIDRDTPGFSIGAVEKKMGLTGSRTTELIFDNARVPKQNLLGAEGEGFKIAMSLLDGGRIGIGAQGVGIAQGALDHALAHAKERQQFGQPIVNFQAIQFKLADMALRTEASRLLVYQAADLRDRGKTCSKEASMAKLYATDSAMWVATEAVQILGGYGYCRDYPVERYFRDAKATQIYEGTNQIQRLVIGKILTK